MSHPNPTYDPTDLPADLEDLIEEEAKAEQARELYDTIRTLTHAGDRDIAEIAKHVPQETRERIIRIFEFAKFN